MRNEQASENKVKARSRTSKKGQKRKYYFPLDFSKTCLASFKLRPGKPDLFNLRAAPPFRCRLTRSPRLGKVGFVFFLFARYVRKREGRSVVIRFRRLRGENEMMDRLVAHHPITTTQITFFRSGDFARNAERGTGLLISTHHFFSPSARYLLSPVDLYPSVPQFEIRTRCQFWPIVQPRVVSTPSYTLPLPPLAR